jgi:hypothetical protein
LSIAFSAFGQNVVSVNFVGGGGPGGSPIGLASTDRAGVAAVENWNNVAAGIATGTVSNLLDASGNVTAVSVQWSCDNTWANMIPQTNAELKLMKGYLDNPTHDTTVTVSEIAYTNYDVYVYFYDDAISGTIGSYAIGGVKLFGEANFAPFQGFFEQATGTNATDSDAFGNYLVLPGISGSNFTLIAHAEASHAPVNAIQIVDRSIPPLNDQCFGATPLALNTFVFGDTTAATIDGGPIVDCGPIKGVWYQVTPNASGSIDVGATSSDFLPEVAVFSGSCDTLKFIDQLCGEFSRTDVNFNVNAFQTYWIRVGGENGMTGRFKLSAVTCLPPVIDRVYYTGQSTETDGIHIHFCADVRGDWAYPAWTVGPGVPVIAGFNQGSCFEVVVPPTNDVPVDVSLTVYPFFCGSPTSGGTSGSTCGFCLSLGQPELLSGGTGAGLGPLLTNACGILSANAHWFRTIVSNTGPMTISTEGSSHVNQIAVYSGTSLTSLTNIGCAPSHQSQLTFNAVSNSAYWYAVDSGTNAASTLRVASGFVPTIQNYSMSNGTFQLLSTVAPPIKYNLLASTNLSLDTSNWQVVLSTNWNTNFPLSTFRLNYSETNLRAYPRRFYQLAPGS